MDLEKIYNEQIDKLQEEKKVLISKNELLKFEYDVLENSEKSSSIIEKKFDLMHSISLNMEIIDEINENILKIKERIKNL